MDPADSTLEQLDFKNLFRALRSLIEGTPQDFLGTSKILLKKPGPADGGTGSTALLQAGC